MQGLHNTQLKKRFSEIVETNALNPVNLQVNEVVSPVIKLSPVSILDTATGSATLRTLDANRTYYLRQVMITNADGSGASVVDKVGVYIQNKGYTEIWCVNSGNVAGDSNSISVNFGEQGVPLTPGTTIVSVGASTTNFFLVEGYYTSDRS